MICLDGWSVSSINRAIVGNLCFQRFLCSLDLIFFSSESLTMLSTSFKMVVRTSVLDLTSSASELTLRSTRASGKEGIQKRSNQSKGVWWRGAHARDLTLPVRIVVLGSQTPKWKSLKSPEKWTKAFLISFPVIRNVMYMWIPGKSSLHFILKTNCNKPRNFILFTVPSCWTLNDRSQLTKVCKGHGN